MSARDDLRRVAANLKARRRDLFLNVAQHALESIQNGSALTGSPGQPVDTGALKASWHLVFPSAWKALISTNVVYAPAIENAVGPHGPLTLRSKVGGFHSVEITRLGLPNIVKYAVAQGGKS